MEYKLVVAVREDLNLSKGKMAVQVAHAAVAAALEAKANHPKWFKAWMDEGQKKVVVGVPDLEALLALERKAIGLKLPRALVQDAGLTELPAGTTTCLAVGPGPNHLVDAVTGHLKLV
ncbi:MAG TPA: peptidyl-tRNA hydrolase Pth2 [Thermoplasmata archaeon]|nr:peptidyl-tRNA hydrolase Pth2 [Thermoplasmata archaeon]